MSVGESFVAVPCFVDSQATASLRISSDEDRPSVAFIFRSTHRFKWRLCRRALRSARWLYGTTCAIHCTTEMGKAARQSVASTNERGGTLHFALVWVVQVALRTNNNTDRQHSPPKQNLPPLDSLAPSSSAPIGPSRQGEAPPKRQTVVNSTHERYGLQQIQAAAATLTENRPVLLVELVDDCVSSGNGIWWLRRLSIRDHIMSCF